MKFISIASMAVLLLTTEAIRTTDDNRAVTLDPPEHFQADSDDIFMRSIHSTYTSHPKDPKDKEGKREITTKSVVTKASALQLANEVVETHKGLTGAAKQDYIAAYFDKAWSHYDVNQEGQIDASFAPMFVRFLLSNQHANIYSQRK